MPKPATPPREERPVFNGLPQFLAWIRKQCDETSVKAVAEKAGLNSPTQLSNLLAGRGCLGEAMAARFGYRRRVQVIYEPIDEAKA